MNTGTNIYTAIMRAADHLDENKELYNFSCGKRPDDPSAGGCALAWIGFFAGIEGDYVRDEIYSNDVCEALTGSREIQTFFNRAGCDISVAEKAPALMRAYARKYHAPVA